MKDESESRKRSIATAISVSGIRATIYDAGCRYGTEWDRRSACLRALVADAAERGDAMLVLEQDDTLIAADRKLLYRAAWDENCPDLRYEHRRAPAEQLLALPDAIAWCWAKGGDWRRRIATSVMVEQLLTDKEPSCPAPTRTGWLSTTGARPRAIRSCRRSGPAVLPTGGRSTDTRGMAGVQGGSEILATIPVRVILTHAQSMDLLRPTNGPTPGDDRGFGTARDRSSGAWGHKAASR
jgi:hypothetical protein